MTPETEIEKRPEATEGEASSTDVAARESEAKAADVNPELIAKALGRLGLPTLLLISLVLIALSVYLSWFLALPNIVIWANKQLWLWIFAWFAVLFAAFAPGYVAWGTWFVIGPVLQTAGERKEKDAAEAVESFEAKLRGSVEPVDYAIYGRKALNAYYLMGQNQARLSFYIGVGAMIFGFLFLLGGLLVQVLDVTRVPYLRQTSSTQIITVGGGLIIEFIAVTFLWIYRAALVQLTVYYKRQLLVHSALIAVAVSTTMGDKRPDALLKIIDTMITPYWEDTTAKLPAPRPHDKSDSA